MATRVDSLDVPVGRLQLGWLPLAVAPAAAIMAGVLAAFADFRALRELILLMMVAGVALTTVRIAPGERGWALLVRALVVGPLTWAAAQLVYVILQLAQGEPFEADRFGPQWAQALGLIGAHALFLGVPTGIAAGVVLVGWQHLKRRAER